MTTLGTRTPLHLTPPDAGSPRWVRSAIVAVLVVGVAARFMSFSALWLDEALTVNISKLPLGEIPDALRRDGSPPLFYMLLHLWMKVFGSGDVAARAFSGVIAVAALPLAWMVGTKVRGRTAGWASLLLMASSPFAIRYGVEVRMYSMVVLLVLIGTLALLELLERRSPGWSAVLAVSTGALLLTHYWAFYLVAAVGAGLLFRARRSDDRGDSDQSATATASATVDGIAVADASVAGAVDVPPPLRITSAGATRGLIAMVLGSLAFLPWLPTFVHQVTTTGTPWGRPPTPRILFGAVFDFTGGYPEASLALGLVAYALCGFGVFGRPGPDGHVHMDLRGRPPGRALAIVVMATLGFGVVAGQLSGSAFAIRYAAVVFPLMIVLMALGVAAFPSHAWMSAALGATVVLGFATSVPGVVSDRTTAGRVAAVLQEKASPGDVVVYCPDQLGPSVSRVAPAGLVHVTYPRGAPPELVDWTRYEQTNDAADPSEFAQDLLARVRSGTDIWVVWAPGYRTFGLQCQQLMDALREERPDSEIEVKISRNTFERPGLVRFPPASTLV